MTSIPAPVLFAFIALLLWPVAQIASLAICRKRLQIVAVDIYGRIVHSPSVSSSSRRASLLATLILAVLYCFGFVVADKTQSAAFLFNRLLQ